MPEIIQKDKHYPFRNGSQCDRICQALLKGEVLDNWEIRERFKCLSHTRRISEIRAKGFDVRSEQVGNSGVWRYWIPKIEQKAA